jgi:RsiW-degrading membrane proteinase PrsW (M82 family)
MIGSFALGALSIIPAALIERQFVSDSVFGSSATFASVATAMLFVVGPVEELSKFLAVRMGAANSRYFVETMDGLVYAAAASFGFASAENIGYAIIYGPEVMLGRGPISTVAHFTFGALWGVALGARTEARVGRIAILGGLVAASAMHGLFNVFAFAWGGYGIIASVALMVIGAVVAQRMFARARLNSPYRFKRSVPHAICRCGNNERLTRANCSVCERPLGRAVNLVCGNCGTANAGTARYCSRCGDQFVPAARRAAVSR